MSTITASRIINAPLGKVWDVFTDIPQAARRLSGLEAVEVVTSEPFGVGYRWRETRKIFGKSSTEEMWVSAVAERQFYEVDASSHGAAYHSRYDFTEVTGGVRVEVAFTGTPVSPVAKAAEVLTGWMAKGSMQKMLQKDLDELAAACEEA